MKLIGKYTLANLFTKVRFCFQSNKFLESIVVLASGTALAQIITLTVAPIITRLYTPDAFGQLAIYVSILSVFAFGSLQYDMAIPIVSSQDEAKNLVHLSIILVAINCIIFIFIAGILYHTTLDCFFDFTKIGILLWLIPISIFISGIDPILSNWMIRNNKYSVIAQAKVTQNSTTFFAQMGCFHFSLGSIGLVIGQVFGQIVGLFAYIRVVYETRCVLSRISLLEIYNVAVTHKKIPIYMGSASRLSNIFSQLPTIFLTSYFGIHVVGLFSLAQRMVRLPMTLLGQSIAQAYLGRLSQSSTNNKEGIETAFLDTAKKLLMIGSIPIMLLGIYGPYLFGIAFGLNWTESGVYARALLPMILAEFVVSPISTTIIVTGNTEFQLVGDFIRTIVVIVTLSVCYALNISSYATVQAYSIAMTFLYIFFFFIYLRGIRRMKGR